MFEGQVVKKLWVASCFSLENGKIEYRLYKKETVKPNEIILQVNIDLS